MFFCFFWLVLTLCCPMMAVAWLIIVLISFSAHLHRRGSQLDRLFTLVRPSVLILPAAAALFIWVFVLSRAGMGRALANLPHLFHDPEHSALNNPFAVPVLLFERNPIFLSLTVLCIVVCLVPKLRRLRMPLWLLLCSSFVLFQILYTAQNIQTTFNQQVLYLPILGTAAFAMLKNRPWKLFCSFYGISVFYSLLNHMTTTTGLRGISMALLPAFAASVLFLVQLIQEHQAELQPRKILRWLATGVILLVLAVQLGSEFYVRLNRTYWDEPGLSHFTVTIPEGAAKGLKTSPAHADSYLSALHSLTFLLDQTDTSGKTFLSCAFAPVLYLDADLDFAAFSAWNFGYRSGLNARILEYMETNPDSVPDLIFCSSPGETLPFMWDGYSALHHNGALLFVRDADSPAEN